ncbi:MAG TPA: pirin family protein [Candidatus Acidoferrum sp.]|nr:pirin family protein [Candidatus Acidoferrum sp.]
MSPRSVAKIISGQPTSDGAGVRLTRMIGTSALEQLDPFLLLDEFKSDRADDYLAGFPDHPHRGFETVTYMLAGAMEHRDHAGNRGELVAGSVQWMTAGRGIVHSEMPRQRDGLMWGFQLWVNLPARDKMIAPRYQDIAPERIPEATLAAGVTARVIAGKVGGVVGPVEGIATEPLYLDVHLSPAAAVELPLTAGHNAFAYVYEGRATLGPASSARDVGAGQLAVLSDGDAIRAASGPDGARLLLLAARPLHEPISRYGPFVMNTREEIMQAVDDYRNGRLLG